jgi:hypothetical protein
MCVYGILINLLKTHCKNSITVCYTQKSCVVYIKACLEQNYPARHLPQRNVGRAKIILHPRMGGHCVVPRNGPAYLGTIMVEDGPAWRFLDDVTIQLDNANSEQELPGIIIVQSVNIV